MEKGKNTNKNALFSANISTKYMHHSAIVGNGQEMTYEKLHRNISFLTGRLRKMGVQKGSRVALWGYNSANWLIAFFAIVRAGGTAVLLNYSLNCDDAAELLTMTDTGFLISGNNSEMKQNPDAMGRLAQMAGIPAEHCLDIRESELVYEKHVKEEPDARTPEEADETAFIIFTSGTTSKPKAVQVSQKALTFDADVFNKNIAGQSGRGVCVAVPLFHILGLLMSYSYLCKGAYVCLPQDYKPETLTKEIGTYRLSDMAAVGAVYMGLAEAQGFEKNVVPNLHICMIAGGMSTPVQMMRLELLYANATFINMYGQSEAAPLTMVTPNDLVEKRAQTVGKPVEGVDLRIINEKGEFLTNGEIGEVVAKGVNLMNGYYNLPADKQPIDENGWLHTGDLGYIDPDGYLHLSGRLKDVIIRGGENISPSEIENALNQLEYIRDVKVMGAPHPIFGESVEACVTMTDGGASFNQEDIKKRLRNQIPRFKIPSHIFLLDQFPLNVNGKVDQRALRVNMLNRLRMIEVNEELAGGVTVFDLVVKNSTYAIVPVTGLVEELAHEIGFGKRHCTTIRMAVEEMLRERIIDAYSAAGDIRVKITLMPEWLRVSFSDNGVEYFIDKRRDTSMSAMIILMAVSDFHTDYSDGKPVYCMDFVYENEFSIQNFLLKSKQDEEQTV